MGMGGSRDAGDGDIDDKGICKGSTKYIARSVCFDSNARRDAVWPDVSARHSKHTHTPIEVHVSIVENRLTSSAAALGYTFKSTSFEYHNTGNMHNGIYRDMMGKHRRGFRWHFITCPPGSRPFEYVLFVCIEFMVKNLKSVDLGTEDKTGRNAATCVPVNRIR